MKLIVLLFMLRSFSAASFISFDELGTLFKNLMLNQLSEKDNTTLQDALEILRRPEFISVTPLDKSSKLRMPVINYIIRSTPWDLAHPQVFCGLILQTATDPSVCPYDDPRFDWQVELPEKSIMKNNKAPVSKHNPLKVAIITDAHIDPLYEAYGVADCDAPTCCKKGQSPRAYYQNYNTDATLEKSLIKANGEIKLDLSDASKIRELNKNAAKNAKRRHSAPAGFWGDYRNCDSPMWAFEDVIENIKENHQDIDVLYYIGDTIDHAVWETSYELLLNMHRYVADKIRETFGDDIFVVPVIGNHETQPTNQFAPNPVTETVHNTTWLYNVLADKWSHYLPAQAQASLRQHGSYSLSVRPGLRVIALNNNIAYKFNWWLMYNPRDCKKQLDWLIQELHQAELDGVKVHILAHIPPGTHDLIYTWTREYNRIVNRFSSTIAAEFNGHTHADEFKIFYSSDNGNPINVAWGGGGIVTYSNFNLNYKIVDINAKTYMPENIYNYIYNLTEANLTPERRPYWYLLYDMKNSFGINDLTPNSINNLVLSMVTTDHRSLDLYVAYYFKLSDELWPKCNDTCKIETLCEAVVTVLWEREKCEYLKDLTLL